jgi:ecotin
MKALRNGFAAGCMMFFAMSAHSEQHPQLKAFPPPPDGMQRFVIVLPHKAREQEDRFGVELVTGREMLTDGVNLLRLGNRIEARTLKGWGYTYYEVTGSSEAMSTLMAPPPGAPQVKRFVSAMPLRIAYNSRLPVVVYAPKGYQVRYRIWTAPETFVQAGRG